MTTNQILTAARDLVARGFCTKTYAKDSSGQPVGSCSSSAVRWCVAGAIDAVVQHDEIAFGEAWTRLQEYTGWDSKKLLRRFDNMRKEKVLAILDGCTGRNSSALDDIMTEVML